MPTLTDVYKTPEIGFLGTKLGFKRSTIVKSKKRNTISYTSKHMVIMRTEISPGKSQINYIKKLSNQTKIFNLRLITNLLLAFSSVCKDLYTVIHTNHDDTFLA